MLAEHEVGVFSGVCFPLPEALGSSNPLRYLKKRLKRWLQPVHFQHCNVKDAGMDQTQSCALRSNGGRRDHTQVGKQGESNCCSPGEAGKASESTGVWRGWWQKDATEALERRGHGQTL